MALDWSCDESTRLKTAPGGRCGHGCPVGGGPRVSAPTTPATARERDAPDSAGVSAIRCSAERPCACRPPTRRRASVRRSREAPTAALDRRRSQQAAPDNLVRRAPCASPGARVVRGPRLARLGRGWRRSGRLRDRERCAWRALGSEASRRDRRAAGTERGRTASGETGAGPGIPLQGRRPRPLDRRGHAARPPVARWSWGRPPGTRRSGLPPSAEPELLACPWPAIRRGWPWPGRAGRGCAISTEGASERRASGGRAGMPAVRLSVRGDPREDRRVRQPRLLLARRAPRRSPGRPGALGRRVVAPRPRGARAERPGALERRLLARRPRRGSRLRAGLSLGVRPSLRQDTEGQLADRGAGRRQPVWPQGRAATLGLGRSTDSRRRAGWVGTAPAAAPSPPWLVRLAAPRAPCHPGCGTPSALEAPPP